MRFKPSALLFRKIEAHYNSCCHTTVLAVDLPDDWNERIMRIAREMHNEKYPDDQVDQDLVNDTYSVLNGGNLSGRNIKLGDEAGADPAVMLMQQNIYKFSHAKTFSELQEINAALFKDGKKRSWEEFRDAVQQINDKYKVNYLQAEWQTANQAGHHARNWENYQKQKHLFPNLKYKTVGDDRVRPEHKDLEGKIAPVDSPFWDKFYPPNGWRCRCYVVQTAELADHDLPEEVKDVKPEFRINVGKNAQVYSDGSIEGSKPHNFFVLAKKIGGKELAKQYELSKPYAPYTKVKAGKGKTVGVSPFADPSDLEKNLQTAKVIASQLDAEINIRAHLDQKVLTTVNPEYEIDGRLADRKGNFKEENYKAINTAFKEAKRQGLEAIVFDFTDSFHDLNITEVNRWVKSNVNENRGRQYHEIIFVHGERAVRATRDQIVKNELMALLKKLKAGA